MVSALIDFVDAGPGGTRLRAAFGTPRETLVARSADEVMPLIDAAHERSRDGAWCIGHVRYEAAHAFDPALPTHERDGPLAWFAVYDAAEPWPALPATSHAPMQWTSALERAAFDERIARIHQAIADGEVYQINLTAPLTRQGTRLSDVFRALFPCGSITGAPKRRAMHWIRELEPEPRGIYCGAIGVLQPGGAATFNVAIRSVVLRDGIARCGIGSGITSDAKAAAEWDEWRHKQRFLQRAARPFELLETLRLQDGEFVHGAAHVERLALAARHFGFDCN